jgi:hypothetical protein
LATLFTATPRRVPHQHLQDNKPIEQPSAFPADSMAATAIQGCADSFPCRCGREQIHLPKLD